MSSFLISLFTFLSLNDPVTYFLFYSVTTSVGICLHACACVMVLCVYVSQYAHEVEEEHDSMYLTH